MALHPSLCVFTNSNDGKSGQENCSLFFGSNSDCSRLAQEKLVLRSPPIIYKSTLASPSKGESSLPRSNSSSLKSHSLETERDVMRSQGVSSPVIEILLQSRKKSSSFSEITPVISFCGINKGKVASKIAIAKWIKLAISIAYSSSERPVPVDLRAHSTRAVSASQAELGGVSVDQICRTASWASFKTFAEHYGVNMSTPGKVAFANTVLLSGCKVPPPPP
ncbi:hypothetical protein XENTR_v10018530 [Xenopus tropicalis]|nr:hypothetical protein XENTR_v10018530 [Xenopus tropicalis]